ncbi:hypothetical protein OAN24_04085, partial [Pseudodesulfovibrio sp.]|nr:hypothetical protein [Pseudodesulfovibrio sp.]
MKKLNILLGDPHHKTMGQHSTMMPLALGLIATATQKLLPHADISIRIETDVTVLCEAIERGGIDVLGLSSYCWNARLSQLLFRKMKERAPETVCIAGGPEFDLATPESCQKYLRGNPDLDFYVVREGELTSAAIIAGLAKGTPVADIKEQCLPGAMSLDPAGNLFPFSHRERIKELDSIPSPYLSGIMDCFFDRGFMPFIQSSRGCPYTCAYCAAGDSWYGKVYHFSLERTKAELAYIAPRMQHSPQTPLAISDSNFGIFENDLELAKYFKELRETYNWPQVFDVSTGKSHMDRIMEMA